MPTVVKMAPIEISSDDDSDDVEIISETRPRVVGASGQQQQQQQRPATMPVPPIRPPAPAAPAPSVPARTTTTTAVSKPQQPNSTKITSTSNAASLPPKKTVGAPSVIPKTAGQSSVSDRCLPATPARPAATASPEPETTTSNSSSARDLSAPPGSLPKTLQLARRSPPPFSPSHLDMSTPVPAQTPPPAAPGKDGDTSSSGASSSDNDEVAGPRRTNRNARKDSPDPVAAGPSTASAPSRVDKGKGKPPPEPKSEEEDEEEEDDDEEERYEVEAILDKREVGRHKGGKPKYKYYIKWLGYPESENTWEPEEMLDSCAEMLADFEARWDPDKEPEVRRKSTGPLVPQKRKAPVESKSESSQGHRKKAAGKEDVKGKGKPVEVKQEVKKPLSEKAAGKRRASDASAASEEPQQQQPQRRGPPIIFPTPLSEIYYRFRLSQPARDSDQPPVRQWRRTLAGAAGGREADIEVENAVDGEGPPANFHFITENRYSQMSVRPEEDALLFCQCLDKCDDADECACGEYDEGPRHMNYDADERLRAGASRLIRECNARCACSDNCGNKVVQRGRKVPVQIFKTRNRGWGVKALMPVKKGTFVTEYVGTITSKEEVETISAANEGKPETWYFFDLDINSQRDVLYSIDGYQYGNIARFINHSCDPNLESYSVFIESQDSQLYRIAFFASRDIERGEEFSVDYAPPRDDGDDNDADDDEDGGSSSKHGGQKGKKGKKGKKQKQQTPKQMRPISTPFQSPRWKATGIKCYCGAENCRGFIYG